MFLGSLIHRKGIDILLRAFQAAGEALAGWTVILVGSGRDRAKYEQLTARLGVADRVFFRGPVQPAEVWNVVAASDVVVLPSRFDGWGVALNEAASMGRALIASDRVGAARHLLESARNGFSVAAGDVQSLAAAMSAYGRCPALARDHGAQSLKLIEPFTPDRNAQRFCHAIRTWQQFSNSSMTSV
jgi:glycosyltransferase involved in cell wall biosynthesis